MLVASNKRIIVSHSLGDAEERRIRSLRALVGPCIRHLLQFYTQSEDQVLSSFRDMAEIVTSNITTLLHALEGAAISNEDQLQCLHYFVFFSVPAHSTSTELVPGIVLPHRVGTQWLLRVLREAMCNKTRRADLDLLPGVSSNSTLSGLAYEALLQRWSSS